WSNCVRNDRSVLFQSGTTNTHSVLGCPISWLAGCLFDTRESRDDIPLKMHEPVQLAFENALLIAMRAKTLRAVFAINRRVDAVALRAPGSHDRHVGRPC